MDWKKEKNQIIKTFSFENFKEAIGFVNQIALLVEEANHHPDIFVFAYKNVKISLSSHDQDQVTARDYALAEKIDKINK